MPRTKRHMPPNTYHHVMTRGNNKHQIFHHAYDYRQYLSLLRKYKQLYRFALYHYCLMPNHVHLLVKVHQQQDFSRFMQRLNLSYTQYYQRRYGWTGYFWQSRFKNKPIADVGHFLQCGKYIELNPVRAKIVRHPSDYEYSSYNYYANGKSNILVTPDPYFIRLNQDSNVRRRQYQRIVVPRSSGWDLSPLEMTN